MNWNNYDTKYIIKRIIIGFAMLILFSILTAKKASAMVYTEPLSFNTGGHSFTVVEDKVITLNAEKYRGLGQGFIIFNAQMTNNITQQAPRSTPVYEIQAIDSNGLPYTCETSSQQWYENNNEEYVIATYKCYVDFRGTYVGLKQFVLKKWSVGSTIIDFGTRITFVTENSEASAIINANQQAIQSVINSGTANTTAITNAINNSTTQVQQAAQQAHQDAQTINNTITNDNVTTSDADDFKNNAAFTDSTGLESVINLPLNMVNSLSNQCVPIQLHIPYLETDATIPCMSTIYRTKFNSLYTLVKLVVNGFLVYRILLKVYELVHEAKQPDEDKLEVIEL